MRCGKEYCLSASGNSSPAYRSRRILATKLMNIQKLKDKTLELKKNIGLLYLAFRHPKTPWYAKAVIAVVVSYALSPIDLIPDFIPVLGYLDDLLLIPGGILLAIKLIPKEVIEECRNQQDHLPDLKSKGIYAGIILALFWALVLYIFLRKTTFFPSIK